MSYIEFNNVVKRYGSGAAEIRALDGASFSVEKGELAVILGASGAGKTTALNILGGMDSATDGNVLIDGQDLFAMGEEARTIFRRRSIGFVFQSYQLVPELDVEQNIIFPLLLDYRRPKQAEVDEILEVLGLAARRHHLPSQLSGGQQQRVAIGRALITRPKLILADEPTGNLDSANSQDVIDLLTQASRRYTALTSAVDRVLRVKDGVVTDLGRKRNEKLS